MTDIADRPAGAFARQDEADDLAFYPLPQLVIHIDEGAVAALTARYRELLPIVRAQTKAAKLGLLVKPRLRSRT